MTDKDRKPGNEFSPSICPIIFHPKYSISIEPVILMINRIRSLIFILRVFWIVFAFL